MNDWRTLLPDLVDSGSHRTQSDLVRAVRDRTGRAVNQASISRELAAIGARKVDGVYRLPEEIDIGARVHDIRPTAGGCLIVLRTDPAFASVLGHVVDDAGIPGVIGTIAGDDTVFVAIEGPEVLTAIQGVLGWQGEARRRRE